jgi:O-antigen ligase
MVSTINDINYLKKIIFISFISGSFLLILLNIKYMGDSSYFLGNDLFNTSKILFDEESKYMLGLYLAVFTPFSIAYTAYNRNLLSFCILSIFGFSLIYNLSRAAIIGVSLSLLFIMMFSSNKKGYAKIVLTLFSVTILALTIFLVKNTTMLTLIFFLNDEFTRLFAFEGGSVTGRVLFLEAGFKSFVDSPLFGIGLGGFKELFIAPWGKNMLAHNNYMLILVEQGIVGFILYLGLLISLFYNLIKKLKHVNYNNSWLYEGVLGSIVSMSFLSIALDFYETLPVWIVISLGGVLLQKKLITNRETQIL